MTTNQIEIAKISELKIKQPTHALVKNTDLVIIKHDSGISVLYGRCLHRGALMADGSIDGTNLVCGVHGWDYRYDTGVSEYNNQEQLHKFQEYVAAKSIGEKICKKLSLSTNLQIIFPRLGKIKTDQTLSLLKEDNLDPVDIAIDIAKLLSRKIN